MSTITLPSAFQPMSCNLQLITDERVWASNFGGVDQANDLLSDRWSAEIELADMSVTDAGAIQALVEALRGSVNDVALYDFARPAPLGTARGTMLVNGAVAQGASSIAIDGVSPGTGTLLPGDLLGIGGRLFRVASAVTASGGAVTVPITGRVRAAIADNAAVTWNAPTLLMRLLSASRIVYRRNRASGCSLVFQERIG